MSSSAELDARDAGAAAEPRPAPVPDLRLIRVPEAVSEAERLAQRGAEGRARTRAEADGYAAGYFRAIGDARRRAATELAQMRQELEAAAAAAAELRRREHAEALTALRTAARQLEEKAQTVRAEVTADAADLAALLVEALLGRELGRLDAETASADVVRRVMAALGDLAAEGSGHGDRVTAVVRLAPGLLEAIEEADRASLTAVGARLVPDAGLAAHDAVVDAGSTRVDLRLHSTLAQVQAALREAPS